MNYLRNNLTSLSHDHDHDHVHDHDHFLFFYVSLYFTTSKKNYNPVHMTIIVKIYRHNTYKNKYSTNKKQIKQKNVKVEVNVEVTCVRRVGQDQRRF